MKKKTIVFDFDGVIHSYTSGWIGLMCIPDKPTKGIKDVLKSLHEKGYEVVIVSTRCVDIDGVIAIKNWLARYGLSEYVDNICKEKPPAICYIDDRAICFDGNTENLVEKITNFKSWTENKEDIP